MLTACSNKASKNNLQGLTDYNQGNYSEAVTSYEAAITLDNTKAEYYINLAMAYIELGQYQNALTQLDFAIELDPKNQSAYRSRGIVYIALNDYENALLAFQAALNLTKGFVGPMEYDILDYRAVAELKKADYNAAIKTYTILIDIGYNLKEHYYLRGTSHLLNNNLSSALKDFDNAIAGDNSNYDLFLNIYTVLDLYNYEEEATSYLEKALLINLKKEDYLAKGKIYFYLKDNTNALNYLLQAKDKGNTEALLFLGKLYTVSGDTTQALLTFQQYIEGNPQSGEVFNQIGMIKFEAGLYQEALDYFQTGLATGDLTAKKSLLFNEAITYEYLLDFATARTKFLEYIETYPEDTKAAREYEFLKTR